MKHDPEKTKFNRSEIKSKIVIPGLINYDRLMSNITNAWDIYIINKEFGLSYTAVKQSAQ